MEPRRVWLTRESVGKVPSTDFEVEEFAAWLRALPHKHKVVVSGNHDETMDASCTAFGKDASESAAQG